MRRRGRPPSSLWARHPRERGGAGHDRHERGRRHFRVRTSDDRAPPPIGRAGHVDDVARELSLPASDGRRYVTGTVLAVDAGGRRPDVSSVIEVHGRLVRDAPGGTSSPAAARESPRRVVGVSGGQLELARRRDRPSPRAGGRGDRDLRRRPSRGNDPWEYRIATIVAALLRLPATSRDRSSRARAGHGWWPRATRRLRFPSPDGALNPAPDFTVRIASERSNRSH